MKVTEFKPGEGNRSPLYRAFDEVSTAVFFFHAKLGIDLESEATRLLIEARKPNGRNNKN